MLALNIDVLRSSVMTACV